MDFPRQQAWFLTNWAICMGQRWLVDNTEAGWSSNYSPGGRKLDRNRSLQFHSNERWRPLVSVTFDALGNLYGATSGGGAAQMGNVFELSTTVAATGAIAHSMTLRATATVVVRSSSVVSTRMAIFTARELWRKSEL